MPDAVSNTSLSALASSGSEVTRGPRTILLAEDDELIRSVVCRILENAGHRVIVANDGEEALHLFAEKHTHISAVVLDVVMPRCGGKSVYSQIRKSHPELPIVFTTGYSPVELEPLLAADSGSALLHKPFRSADLLITLDRLLAR